MTNLGDIYLAVLDKLGKDAFGGVLSPALFNRVLSFVNIEMLNERLSVLEMNQNVQEDLRPFNKIIGDGFNQPLYTKKNQNYSTVDPPNDFARLVSVRHFTYDNTSCTDSSFRERLVELLSNSDFRARLSSSLDFPSVRRPICTFENNLILVAPKSVENVSVTYIRIPTTPFFDFDTVDGVIEYLPPGTEHSNGDPSLSVEPEWPIDTWNEMVERLFQQVSINIKSVEDIQMVKPFTP